MEECFEAVKIVLPERILEKIGVQSGDIEVTETSSQDPNLQRTVEQDSVEVDKTSPLERIFERIRFTEVVKSVSPERISERMCEQREVIDVTEFLSQERSLLRGSDARCDQDLTPRPSVQLSSFSMI